LRNVDGFIVTFR